MLYGGWGQPDLNPRWREGAAERDDSEGHRERVGLGLPLLQRSLPLLVLLLLRRLNHRSGPRWGREREDSGTVGEEKKERAHGQLEHQRRHRVRHPLPAATARCVALAARWTPRKHCSELLRLATVYAESEAGGGQVVGRVVGDEAGEARVVGLGEEEMERLALHCRCGAARFPLGVRRRPGSALLRPMGLSSCSLVPAQGRLPPESIFAQTCEYMWLISRSIRLYINR